MVNAVLVVLVTQVSMAQDHCEHRVRAMSAVCAVEELGGTRSAREKSLQKRRKPLIARY